MESTIDIHWDCAVHGIGRIAVSKRDDIQHRPVRDQPPFERWLHLHPKSAPALIRGNKAQVRGAGVVASGQDWLPHVGGLGCIRVDGVDYVVSKRWVAGGGKVGGCAWSGEVGIRGAAIAGSQVTEVR